MLVEEGIGEGRRSRRTLKCAGRGNINAFSTPIFSARNQRRFPSSNADFRCR